MRSIFHFAVAIAGAYGCTQIPAPRVQIAMPECYALSYFDPVGEAEAEWFPAGVALLPGENGGEVLSVPSAGDRIEFWKMFMGDATWKRLASDSQSLSFTNGYTAVELMVMHDGRTLNGHSTIHFDAIQPGPKPLMRVHGRRTNCERVFPDDPSEDLN